MSQIKILSSQRFLDQDVVEQKKKKLKKDRTTKVRIPCSYVGKVNDPDFSEFDYAIIVDKHHTAEAAKQLGIKIEFNIKDDPEKLTGDDLLEARYIDSAYYDFETGIDEF